MAKRRKQATEPLRAWPFAILLIAFALRLIAAVQLGKLPLSRTLQLDSNEYLTWGRRIASGDFTMPNPPPHGPGYPFFLGAILALTGGSLIAVQVIQAAIGALTCWFTGRAARAWFGERAGIVASALLALYAPLIWIDASIYAEGLLICLMAAFMWAIATHRHVAISTAIVFAAIVVRPTALVLLPVLFVFGTKSWRARAALAAIVVIAFTAVAVPIQAYGGLNFYLGNSPLRDGTASARIGGDWDRIEGDAARHRQLTVRDEDRYFVRKTFEEIAEQPLAYARLLLRKTALTFGNVEIRDSFSFYFFRPFSPVLWLIPFAVLFGCAVAGAFAIDWRGEGARVSASYVLLTALTCIGLVVGSRYRMPMVIGLAIIASAIVNRWTSFAALRMTVVALIAATASIFVSHPPSHNLSEEWAWTARSLQREGDLDTAKDAARQALEQNPQSALAYDTAATSERSPAVAIPLLERAIAITPDFFEAHLHLGGAYAVTGQIPKAQQQYEAAMIIDPRDARPVRQAAQIAMQQRRILDAITLYARAATLDPHDVNSVWQVARLWGAAGKPELGLSAAQRAASIERPSGDEWLLTATLAMHAHRFEAAGRALDLARATGANPINVTLTGALLAFETGDLDRADAMVDSVLEQAPELTEAELLKGAIAAKKRPAGANPSGPGGHELK